MELLYHYLWKHRLLGENIVTVDGREIEVVCPGIHNNDAGPDFSAARIRVDGQEWCGNVEIHVRASDWIRHGHDRDAAYDSVILHVVGINDSVITDKNGKRIPQVIATFPESFVQLYARLSENINDSACEALLSALPSLLVTDWLDSLAVERMQTKSRRILDALDYLDGDWERVCFVALARALGFGLNSDPFEMLARSVPLRVMARHSDDIMQLEAVLFGQAGMLDTSIHIFDEYYQRLCREYFFLARKYGLRPLKRDIWKFARTRPQNFPTRRIALLARALKGGFSLLSRVIDRNCRIEEMRKCFDWTLDGYWLDHFDFDVPGNHLPAGLSENNVDLLLINFAAPLIYAYGAYQGDADTAGRGLDIWSGLEAENNSVIRRWQKAGIGCSCATDSQALLQLRREYCDRHRCLECRFGHALLREASGRRLSFHKLVQ